MKLSLPQTKEVMWRINWWNLPRCRIKGQEIKIIKEKVLEIENRN